MRGSQKTCPWSRETPAGSFFTERSVERVEGEGSRVIYPDHTIGVFYWPMEGAPMERPWQVLVMIGVSVACGSGPV